jgi:accessory colonization factor AcfC
MQAAKTNADLFYSGSENMMTDFTSLFSGQIDPVTIDPIYARSAIIIVHPGNPKNIKGFEDLLRPGVTVMIVQGSGQTGLWEDIAGRTADVAIIRALRSNIVAFAPDTATAHGVWNGPNPPGCAAGERFENIERFTLHQFFVDGSQGPPCDPSCI